jgi:molybdopterin-guanine dinucleotide biosynthesis protein A
MNKSVDITISETNKPQVESLIKNNRDLLWVKKFFREYVQNLLTEENKQELDQDDFYLMEGYIESLLEYKEVIKKIHPNNDFSISTIEELILWLNLDEFEELYSKKEPNFFIRFWIIKNRKLFFWKEFYNIKTRKDFEKLIENKEWIGIKGLIEYWEPENIELFFWKDFYNIKTREDLEKLMENPNWKIIMDLIENLNPKNRELFFLKDWIIRTREDLEKLMENPNLKIIKDLIYYWKPKNRELFFWKDWIIKTREDLEKLMENQNWETLKDLIYYWKPKNIELFFLEGFYNIKTIEDLEELMENPNWEIINLYLVMSLWSTILNWLKDKLKKNTNASIYDIMEEDIDHFFYFKKMESHKQDTSWIANILSKQNVTEEEKNLLKKLWIEGNKLEISLYLRYWHTVDYPEIWEYIGLFINSYLEKWYSKYISSIRLIPIRIWQKPWKSFFEKAKLITFYPVKWDDFKLALKKYSIPFHLSHSLYKDTENLPFVVSNSRDNTEKNSIKSIFDLEREYDKNSTWDINLETIFEEILRILQEIEKQLDLLVDKY